MQLVLPVTFRKQDSFELFINGPNEQLITHIFDTLDDKRFVSQSSQRMSYINGPEAVGKTHILLATCELAAQRGLSQQYIDLKKMMNFPTDALNGLLMQDVICIDNLHLVSGNLDWQIAIFDAINQFTENQNKLLLISSSLSVEALDYSLLDLKTRLIWGTNFALNPLSDDDKLKAILLHMQALGLSLTTMLQNF